MPHVNEPSQMAQLSSIIPPELGVFSRPPDPNKPAMPALPKAESKAKKRLGIPRISIMKRTVDPSEVMRHLFPNGVK